MDALIFNSGYGSRVADLIKDSHKSLLKIHGETILARQLRILSNFDIGRVLITTGPNAEKIQQEVNNKNYPFEIVFIHSLKYAETNYIYSMFLASEHLNGDLLILHGDLVFNSDVIKKLLDEKSDCVLVDEDKSAYEKDFKALLIDGYVKKISTKHNEYGYGLQPIYKLSKTSFFKWKEKVREYVEQDKVKVYAEDALNELLLNQIDIKGIIIDDDYCKEIDNPTDYENVKKEICDFDYNQEIIIGPFEKVIGDNLPGNSKILVVTFSANEDMVKQKLSFVKNRKTLIYDKANPEQEEILDQLELIDEYNPDFVISIGGGSVIDFSKCLIDFSKIITTHIAIPTTCGTGSESTRFAVYYVNAIKQSLCKNKVLPEIAILDTSLLFSLPERVLVSSILDAFAQSVESFWSKKATEQSQNYSVEAIKIIYPILFDGIDNSLTKLKKLQLASNLAGRAINITTTTSAHALSYNLTKLFGIPHGIAVNMTLPYIWKLHNEKIINFDKIMKRILDATNSSNNLELISKIMNLLDDYCVWEKVSVKKNELNYLVNNVNLERLKNNPYKLNKNHIYNIYIQALRT